MKNLIIATSMLLSLSAVAQEVMAPGVCAVAYNKADPRLTSHLVIYNGDKVPNLGKIQLSPELGSWDNKITNVKVARGCTFIGYQYQNYGINYNNGDIVGFASTLENNTTAPVRKFRLSETAYDNAISSIKCFCI